MRGIGNFLSCLKVAAKGMKRAKSTRATGATNKKSRAAEIPRPFVDAIQKQRLACAETVSEFPFKKKRVRVLNNVSEVQESCENGILYWMSRDMRVQDNWALLYAQRLALKMELPLLVAFSLVPRFLNSTSRHYEFLLAGLEEVAQESESLNIHFHLLIGPAAERIPQLVREKQLGAVVCDFSPLRESLSWVEAIKQALPASVPLLQVDAHNVVPVWEASDKQEYSARFMRNKINKQLTDYLTEFPPVIRHPYVGKAAQAQVDWAAARASLECPAALVTAGEAFPQPGYNAACAQLRRFCERLENYSKERNDPTKDAVSGLSPWLHFGQISAHRCILEVQRHKARHPEDVSAFCEEAIVRRELADNFCYYNKDYDNLNGAHAWARKTLDAHRKDKREFVYTLEDFEAARTHDPLWNAAQKQLVHEGKMHGFLRMYWAKKILEWSPTPEEALAIAIRLNDTHSLDGRDPNGYVGCLWSIAGLHDQPWMERPVFGKIRFMNFKGCKRKFDVEAFMKCYGT